MAPYQLEKCYHVIKATQDEARLEFDKLKCRAGARRQSKRRYNEGPCKNRGYRHIAIPEPQCRVDVEVAYAARQRLYEQEDAFECGDFGGSEFE